MTRHLVLALSVALAGLAGVPVPGRGLATVSIPAPPDLLSTSPTEVVLEAAESYISASPSGDVLLTATEPHLNDAGELVGELCVREAPGFEHRDCYPSGSASGTWSPAWNHDESAVAVVRAGSSRAGERNDVVWVLDLDDGSAHPVSPTDAWLPWSPVAAWTGDGHLLYSWPSEDGTEILSDDGRSIALGPGARVESVIDAVDSLRFVGEVDSVHGLFEVPLNPDVDRAVPQLLMRLALDEALVDVGRDLEWAIVQQLDVHASTAHLIRIADGTELPLPQAHVATLDPPGAFLASLSVEASGHRAELTLWNLVEGTLSSLASTSFPHPDDTYYYDGIDRTATRLVIAASTDGQPETVRVFRLDGRSTDGNAPM